MFRFLIFGMLGILGSVAFTTARRMVVEKRLVLTGEASIILFPFWGLIAFIYPPIALHLGSMPWYGRGAVYTVAFFIFQSLIGLGLTRIGMCPWKYSGSGAIGGIVRIHDAPLWFGAGLAVEWIYPYVKGAAVALQ